MDWWIFEPAIPALAASFALALAGRLLRRPWLGGLAAGGGLLLGWWWVFGLLTASPRQLPERLPLLALMLLGFAALGVAGSGRARLGMLATAAGVVAAGWWMAGAPRNTADLLAALPVLAGVAAFAALALRQGWREQEKWSGALAAAALLAGLALAALPGPGLVLGGALFGAALGAAAIGAAPRGLPAALPVAGGMAGLAALPLLARGAPADWAAAAAPLAVLWLAPWIRRWLPRSGGVVLAALAAALPVLALAWLLG